MQPGVPFTPLSELGEFGLIKRLTDKFTIHHPEVLLGVGDDAAVLDQGDDQCLLVTTDLMAEGVHFDLAYAPLQQVGYKAAVTNFSDVYAMNGLPTAITVALAASARTSVEAMQALYAGLHKACVEHGVDLIGGDTSSSRAGLFISITALGKAQLQELTFRSGARENDLIVVSGDLGGAYAGLQILEREKQVFLSNPEIQPDLRTYPYVIQRQLQPIARRSVVQVLRQQGVQPTSMIDLSDGLAGDLGHICTASGLGCRIYQQRLPIHPETEAVATLFNLPATTLALYGGEDYELLFTIHPQELERVQHVDGLTVIGHMTTEATGRQLVLADGSSAPLAARSFAHFT